MIVEDIDIIQNLMDMGLSEREAKVYRVLLGVSEITASAIPKFTNVPRTKVYEALNSLMRKGFCKEVTPACNGQNGQTFAAIDPNIALEGLMYIEKKKMEKLEAINTQLSGILSNIYNNSTLRLKDYDFIEVLRGKQEIIHRYIDLRQNAKIEILELSKGDYTMSEEEANQEADENEQLINQGTKIKVIYESDEILSGESEYFHRKNAEIGVQAKMMPILPCKMSLFDKKIVMLPLFDPIAEELNMTALIIEHPALYTLLHETFSSYWNTAENINNVNNK